VWSDLDPADPLDPLDPLRWTLRPVVRCPATSSCRLDGSLKSVSGSGLDRPLWDGEDREITDLADLAGERSAPERWAPERSAPERSAPERSAPERSAPTPGAPDRPDPGARTRRWLPELPGRMLK
jgi:hypothetical protein